MQKHCCLSLLLEADVLKQAEQSAMASLLTRFVIYFIDNFSWLESIYNQ